MVRCSMAIPPVSAGVADPRAGRRYCSVFRTSGGWCCPLAGVGVHSLIRCASPTDGNKVAVFGDLAGYILVDRQQLSVTIARERFADTDQAGVVLIDRVGG